MNKMIWVEELRTASKSTGRFSHFWYLTVKFHTLLAVCFNPRHEPWLTSTLFVPYALFITSFCLDLLKCFQTSYLLTKNRQMFWKYSKLQRSWQKCLQSTLNTKKILGINDVYKTARSRCTLSRTSSKVRIGNTRDSRCSRYRLYTV